MEEVLLSIRLSAIISRERLNGDRSFCWGRFEYILVEGQGALTHMGYSSVTLGLIHGTMPDAMILCHQPTRLKDDYGLILPGLKNIIRFMNRS